MQAGGLGHGDKGVGVIDGGGAATKGGGSGLDGDYDFFYENRFRRREGARRVSSMYM